MQGERSLDRAQGGLGIGLTLVKSLVEMHGGSVEVRSEGVDRGTEVILLLPLDLEETLPVPGEADADPSSEAAPKSRRVLVVEDNADTAQTLADLVALWGHEVVRAASGQDALRLALDFQPDVVLMDIGLPGMDGYEVARRLRSKSSEEPAGAAPVLVGITGYGQARDRTRARDAGFDHYLVKPPDPATLRLLLGSEAGRRAPAGGRRRRRCEAPDTPAGVASIPGRPARRW